MEESESYKKIPIIDFSSISLDVENDGWTNEELIQVSDRLVEVFSDTGFAYLKNTGISSHLIERVNNAADTFFSLPLADKISYSIKESSGNQGWVPSAAERVNLSTEDFKECFNITPGGLQSGNMPVHVNDFKDSVETCLRDFIELSRRLLTCIAVGLKLKDPEYFLHCHNFEESTGSTMRMLNYYPMADQDSEQAVLRLGEHSDYGTITLLCQDLTGGLQVLSKENKWIDVTPIPDTVVVNVADLLKIWTGHRLNSAVHRVINTREQLNRKSVRRSVVFFCHPNPDTVVEELQELKSTPRSGTLNGHGNIEDQHPVTAGEYLAMKLRQTHKY